MAELSSCVSEVKMITPEGKQMHITDRERHLMRVLRSSFGLLGIVHEVVVRVRPLTPVKIDYQVMTLKDFSSRYAGLVESERALRLHVSPFHDRITLERRTLDHSAALNRSRLWQIKHSVIRN